MIIVKEVEQRVLGHYGKKRTGHFKSQPQKVPYKVQQLAFDVENETVIITLDNEKNRNTLLHALDAYKYFSGSGFEAPEFKVTAQ
ncbi:MAG: hypothetical protein AB7F64_01335, partial [Gammaproteobacteria bacterium]